MTGGGGSESDADSDAACNGFFGIGGGVGGVIGIAMGSIGDGTGDRGSGVGVVGVSVGVGGELRRIVSATLLRAVPLTSPVALRALPCGPSADADVWETFEGGGSDRERRRCRVSCFVETCTAHPRPSKRSQQYRAPSTWRHVTSRGRLFSVPNGSTLSNRSVSHKRWLSTTPAFANASLSFRFKYVSHNFFSGMPSGTTTDKTWMILSAG